MNLAPESRGSLQVTFGTSLIFAFCSSLKHASTCSTCYKTSEAVTPPGDVKSSSRQASRVILKILETEEMNVDMRYIDLSSFPAFSLTC